MASDTLDRVRLILVNLLGVEPVVVQPETRLVPEHDGHGRALPSKTPDLGCDSLDVVELVMSFEEEFGVEIDDDEGTQLHDSGTVQSCVDLIESKLVAQAA